MGSWDLLRKGLSPVLKRLQASKPHDPGQLPRAPGEEITTNLFLFLKNETNRNQLTVH